MMCVVRHMTPRLCGRLPPSWLTPLYWPVTFVWHDPPTGLYDGYGGYGDASGGRHGN